MGVHCPAPGETVLELLTDGEQPAPANSRNNKRIPRQYRLPLKRSDTTRVTPSDWISRSDWFSGYEVFSDNTSSFGPQVSGLFNGARRRIRRETRHEARFPKRKRRENYRESCLRPLPRLFGSVGTGFNRGSQVRITAGQSEQEDILHRGWAAVKAANWPNCGQISKYFANKGEFSPEAQFGPSQKRGGRRSTPGIQALEISTTACITCSSIDSRVLSPVSVSRPIASSICSDS